MSSANAPYSFNSRARLNPFAYRAQQFHEELKRHNPNYGARLILSIQPNIKYDEVWARMNNYGKQEFITSLGGQMFIDSLLLKYEFDLNKVRIEGDSEKHWPRILLYKK